MISKLRLEAEGTTLDEVLKDIEQATKAAKLPKDLHVHDEHYERVHDTLFKGRRVFGRGPGAAAVTSGLPQTSIQRPWISVNPINATSGTSVNYRPIKPPHSDPK